MAEREVEEQDLGAIIATELRQARGFDSTELSGKRARALEYLRGEMNDTPPRPNGSKQTDRTFAEVLAWTLPGVVAVFASSNQFVRYTKAKAETDDWARDATDFTNHSFWNEGNGYPVIYDVIHDALQLGNGVIQSYWEPPRTETKIFRDKTEMEIAALMEEGWQGVGLQPKPGKPTTELVPDPLTGDYVEAEVPTLTVKLGKVGRPGKICDIACKPENLRLNSMATTIEEARFVAYYHDDKTRSDLMEMAEDYGWDREVIANLSSFSRSGSLNEVSLARDYTEPVNTNSPVKSGDPIDLHECYLRVDRDGDGIAELIQAWYAGDPSSGTVLSDEEYEAEVPFTDIRCYPVPHRFDAEGAFDRTEDIQRVKTVLLRGLLDNSYAVGLPMREAEADSVVNADILANPRFGGTIWRKKGSMASAPIIDHVVPFIGDKLQLALTYMDEMTSKRTGVSRTTMALDPETLQNQSATANNNNKTAAYTQIELVARNAAEYGGFTKHFAKRLKLAITHQKLRQIPDKKAESGFREINPEQWDANMAVTVNTGLGTGSRDRDMAMLNLIMQNQMAMAIQLKEAGLTNKALEMIQKIRKTAVLLAESSGLHDPEDYYPEFTDQDLQQAMQQAEERAKQPPPEVMIEQARGQTAQQVEQQKGAVQKELKGVDAQVSMHEAQLKAQGDVAKNTAEMQADLQVKAAERENAIVIENIRAQNAINLKSMDIAWQREKAAQDAQLQREGLMNSAGIAESNNAARAQIAKQKPKPNGKPA